MPLKGRFLKYMIETKVTYTLEHDGHFYLVENFPSRISLLESASQRLQGLEWD
jgi:hypothetical protein